MAYAYCQTFFVDPTAVNKATKVNITGINLWFRAKPRIDGNKSGIFGPGVNVGLVPTKFGVPLFGQDKVDTDIIWSRQEWGSVVVRHAIKNMAIPVVTMVGLDSGQLLGGAGVTETVFAWPGIDRLAIDSILHRDFPVLEADVFFIALAFVAINLVVDVLYTWLDPRVRVR